MFAMDLAAFRAHQRAFLTQLKSRRKPVLYSVEGLEIKVNPDVFPPATDTKLLAANINLKPDEKILDLTTGSGVFSVIAGLQGASGIAVDINPKAVKNAQENCSKYGVNVRIIQSDLFDKVPKGQFDYIFVNGPYFEGKIKDPLDYACYGSRDFLERLFSRVKAYLKQEGKVLITLSEGSDLKHFLKTIRKNNLRSTLIATKRSDDGQRTYYLYIVIYP